MKEETKYIVVVQFEDGTQQEYIVFGEQNIGTGISYKGGKIVAYRQLSKKYSDQQI